MMQFNFVEESQQTSCIISVRNQTKMMSFILVFDLVDHKGGISIYVKGLDPQVDGFFDTHDTSFIFCDVVGAIKQQPGGKWDMRTLGSNDDCPNSIAKDINCSIKD